MNPRVRKAVRELQANPGRTALVVLALVIGLWGLGSLTVSYTVLTNDLRENFLRTRPPHAALASKDFGRLDLAAFRRRPEIERAEFRDLSLQRIEVYPDQWIPVWLFGVEDFRTFQVARFYRERGQQIPDPGTMLIERDGLNISDLRVGSVARVRAGSTTRRVPITGITFDPAQAPATQDHFIYAYVDKQTYTAITGEPANRRLVFRLKHVRTKAEVQKLTDAIVADLRAEGVAVDHVKIPKLDEHPHQWQLNTLIALQGAIGLLAFLLSAILVSQLMGAILAQQVRQVGVLKAIGASRRQVLEIYLLMVLMLGLAATAVAVPLAVKSGYAFAGFVAGVINFNLLTTRLPLDAFLLLVLAGLALPLLSSLPALLRGTRVSVYEALSDYGLGPTAPLGRAGRTRALPLSPGLRLALRNARRRQRRLAVTVLAMGLGVAIFSTGFNVRQALLVFQRATGKATKHDVQVVLKRPVPLQTALAPFRGIPAVRRIEAWNGGRGELQSRIVSTSDGIGIVALPYDTTLFAPEIVAGRWLRASQEPEVVLNQGAREALGNPALGTHRVLSIKGTRVNVRIVGVIKELDKGKIYVDKARYDALINPGHLANTLMFVAQHKDYDQVLALKKSVERAVAASNLNVLYVMSQAERAKIISDHLNIILTTFAVLALVVLVVSALGMASATGINVMERTREIGVLRAVGATPKMIYGLFVAEGLVVSTASFLFGLLLAWPLSVLGSGFFGNLIIGGDMPLPVAFSHVGAGITLGVTFAFGWLASRVPARQAVTVSTRQALLYG